MKKNVTTTRGLMVGRFQPFHKGHLQLSKQILRECNELIHAALLESGLDLAKCYIIPIANDENNARWLGQLKSMVPHFDVLYSGNEFVKVLAQQQPIRVKKPFFSKKNEYNGTNIRRHLAAAASITSSMRPRKKSQNWKRLVPNAVSRLIEEIDG